MRKFILTALAVLVGIASYAGITTYTFTSLKWASKVGATACDGTSDGWVSDKDASEYNTGRTDAQGRLYSQGVSVKTGTTGAGATSVQSFTEVRRIDFNFCQNSSDGRGVIYVQVGDNDYDSIVVYKPETSGSGIYMRDSTIRFSTPQTGKIRFWITCTKNAINLNSITIRAKEGGSNPFTESSYQLVTDVNQLEDYDQIIFGAATSNYIMGYFDEWESKNNIKAIKGVYSSDRQTVRENDAAIYTLWIMEDELTGETAYTFVDELRYEQAFLVASGGQTKNRLAIWDDFTSSVYGDYGVWDVDIAADGKATIMSLGTSAGKYIQLNAGNASGPIYACYENQNYEKVCIYRRVEAIGDKAAIVAPMCNFGTAILKDGIAKGSKEITINANKLEENIAVSFKSENGIFSTNSSSIDYEGDILTISYSVSTPGRYTDTLVLTSGEITTEAVVMLDVQPTRKINEVVNLEDYTTVYLDTVVVTKKYDKYIFIRDETGSMLIYDATNAKTGKPYGQGLKNGDVLTGVTGIFNNYFGLPELSPNQAWSVYFQTRTTLPEVVSSVDSADVCRYVRLQDIIVDGGKADINGKEISIIDKFNTGIISGITTQLDAIVMWSWDNLELWVVNQSTTTDIPATNNSEAGQSSKYIHNGQLIIKNNEQQYNAQGARIQ